MSSKSWGRFTKIFLRGKVFYVTDLFSFLFLGGARSMPSRSAFCAKGIWLISFSVYGKTSTGTGAFTKCSSKSGILSIIRSLLSLRIIRRSASLVVVYVSLAIDPKRIILRMLSSFMIIRAANSDSFLRTCFLFKNFAFCILNDLIGIGYCTFRIFFCKVIHGRSPVKPIRITCWNIKLVKCRSFVDKVFIRSDLLW